MSINIKGRETREPRKKGMMLYYDQLETILETFTYEKTGRLLEILTAYEMFGEEIENESDDAMVIAFAKFIRPQLDRDLEKFRLKCKKNQDNAEKRWANAGITTWLSGVPQFKDDKAKARYFARYGILTWGDEYPQFKSAEARDKYFEEYGQPPYHVE